MVSRYMKAVLAGSVVATIITGFHVVVGLLIKWLSGNPIDQLVSIKHLFLYVIVLLLCSGYMSVQEPDEN